MCFVGAEGKEHFGKRVAKASACGQVFGSDRFAYCRSPRANLRIMRSHPQSLLRTNKKHTRDGCVLFGAEKRIRAFSGAPRWAIINCPFCLTSTTYSLSRKAKRSFTLAAPTLESSSSVLYQKQKNTPHKVCSFVLAQRRGFEPPVRFRRTHDFQSCSLNHSDISANFRHFVQVPIYITVFFKKMQAFLLHFRKIFLKTMI